MPHQNIREPVNAVYSHPEQGKILGYNWVKRLLRRTTIRQKIGLGYALAIGVAVVGSIGGQLVGQHYERQAWQEHVRATEEEHLLSNLLNSVIAARFHQQQFISYLDRPQLFKKENKLFLERMEKTQQIFSTLKSDVASHFNNLEPDVSDLKNFVLLYESSVESYRQHLEAVLKEINFEQKQPEVFTAAQRSLLDLSKSEVVHHFDNLSHDLNKLVEISYQEAQESDAAFKRAHQLNIQIRNFSLIFSIALAIFLAIYISRAIAIPLEAVTQVVDKAIEDGNFTLQAPVTTSDEVGVLATSFNNLIQRVAEYTQELELARETLTQRVEKRTQELKHKNEELQKTHEELEQVNQQLTITIEKEKELNEIKSRFIAMTSHDFRTPLTAILGSAELLEYYNHKLNEKEKTKLFSKIKTAIQKMTELLNDVLIFSKAEAGKSEFNPDTIDLLAFCRELVEDMQLGAGKNHVIKIVERGDCLNTCMDEKLLHHIFTNLLGNAIKYSPEGSTIYFELVCEGGEATFRIQDTGIGIPASEQARLFQPFERASNVGTISGTGLGLAIVNNCVELHRGKITVNSSVGAGTTFIVTLPTFFATPI